MEKQNVLEGNSLEGQWLTLHASTVESPGSITGQGTRILQVVWCSQKKEEKEENVVYIYVCVCVCIYIYIYIYMNIIQPLKRRKFGSLQQYEWTLKTLY